MNRSLIWLAVACLAGGIGGYFVGSVVSIAASGLCPGLDPGIQWAGAALGVGVAAFGVLGQRPDPRACNRQDPPMPPID